MRGWILSTITVMTIVTAAILSARQKSHNYQSLEGLRVGLRVEELAFLGRPASASARERIYLLPDQSKLIVMLHDDFVTSAWMQLKQPLKIEDPQFKRLRFVQMGVDGSLNPTWFYAGAGDQGKIFKISQTGLIESITWVKPFEHAGPSRQLQALLQEFSVQRPL